MGILVWKKDVKKAMTEETRQWMGLNDTGISWIKNMSDDVKEKWVAQLFSRSKRIEIQKSFPNAVDMKIVISKLKDHPKVTDYEREKLMYKKGVMKDQYLVSVGQNGTSIWTMKMIINFQLAIEEAIQILRSGNDENQI